MSIFEFDKEKEWRLFGEAEREAGRKEGREAGRKEGKEAGRKEGREEGRKEVLRELIIPLVKDGILTLQEAAKRSDFPEEELKKYI